MTSPPSGSRQVGRKRDPRIEPLALNAALEVYALHGWSGFTFDAVARTSGIGKPAIYRRWESKELLLVSAFNQTNFPTARDLGSLKADARDYALQWAAWYSAPFLPEAGVRILLDCANNKELDRLYKEVIVAPRGKAARQVTRRAVARGELPDGTRATMLPDVLLGATFMHWAFAINRDDPAFDQHMRDYVERLLSLTLSGLGAQ